MQGSGEISPSSSRSRDEQQQQQQQQPKRVSTRPPGWGMDAPLQNRPGVPMEFDPPMPLGNMSLGMPAQQTIGKPSVKSSFRSLTPVYGTVSPPRGLSGVLRRLAYRIPDYKPRRWMLLMLADRIDVIEHNIVPAATLVGVVAGALAVGVVGLRALLQHK